MKKVKSRARNIIVEKIDLRTDPRMKTVHFRISIGDAILFDISTAEMKKLVKIGKTYFRKTKSEIR